MTNEETKFLHSSFLILNFLIPRDQYTHRMPEHILRWGLLGTARINRAVIPPLRNSARNTLTAVASRSSEKVKAYADEWGIERRFDSYEALLADPNIDVVYISLPNSLHAEWTAKAIEAGKHVLCEKPFTTTVDEIDVILSLLKVRPRVVAEAFMYRHHPQTLGVKAAIDAGKIGEVMTVRGSFSFTQSRGGDVRLNKELAGGSLWDVGCYPVSYARMILGEEPVEVFAWQTIGPSGVDEMFAGQLRFASGKVAQIDSSFRVPFRTNIEIVGTDGLIVVQAPFKPQADSKVYIGTASDQLELLPLPTGDLYQGEIEDMADAILDGKPPRISLQDSRNNIATLVALYKSARMGQVVQVN